MSEQMFHACRERDAARGGRLPGEVDCRLCGREAGASCVQRFAEVGSAVFNLMVPPASEAEREKGGE